MFCTCFFVFVFFFPPVTRDVCCQDALVDYEHLIRLKFSSQILTTFSIAEDQQHRRLLAVSQGVAKADVSDIHDGSDTWTAQGLRLALGEINRY